MLIGCIYAATSEEQPATDQFKTKAVSLAIKGGLKTYLAKSDFQQLKRAKIKEINQMPEQQFAAEFSQTWPTLKKCPLIVAQFNLRPGMSKTAVVKIIGRLSLADCYRAIDNIPDEVVIEQFQHRLSNSETNDKSFAEQLNDMMSRFVNGNGG